MSAAAVAALGDEALIITLEQYRSEVQLPFIVGGFPFELVPRARRSLMTLTIVSASSSHRRSHGGQLERTVFRVHLPLFPQQLAPFELLGRC